MMVFHYRQRNISSYTPKLKINNKPIELVHEFNFLGINLDSCMTWNSHINKISNKLSCAIGIFRRLKKHLPLYFLKTLYSSLFLSYVNYGILLWGNNIKRITKLQKFAVRAISNSRYNAHSDPLFKSLRLLKVSDIYELNLLKFHFKYKDDLLPKYFCNMFEDEQQTHTYETRNRNAPKPPKTSSAEKALRYMLPKTISQTPECITSKTETHSINGYTNYIKNMMLDRYNKTCVQADCYICQLN